MATSDDDAGTGGSADADTHVTDRPVEAPPVDQPAWGRIGSGVGRYVVVETIGVGGMGEVVRAYDPKLRREVALKRVRPGRLGDEGEARLVREARAMAQLSHPNVVAVYDVEVEGDTVTLAMEYVKGTTLSAWIDERRPWREIVATFRHAGAGLAAAHDAGLIHRDFKPSNVLVAEDGRVKVTDFGLARPAGASPSQLGVSTADGDSEMTQAGSILGTPKYMAPEQHEGRALGPLSDQYSFCVALWEALTGTAPFSGPDLLVAKREGPGAWPRTASVPAPIVDAVRRGLAVVPADRHASMTQLLDALRHDPDARRRRVWTSVGGILVLGAGIFAAVSGRPTEATTCTGASERLAGVWDDSRRQAVSQSIVGTNASYAAATWERVEMELDRYAAAWVEHHEEACRATTVRGEQSAQAMDLRIACLDRARGELDATVDILAGGDPAVVLQATRLAARLPRLDHCADIEALRAHAPPTEDEAASREAESVRADLATVSVLRRAGKLADANEQLSLLWDRIEELGDAEILGRSQAIRAGLLSDLGELEPAVAEYRRAIGTALEAGDDDTTAHTCANMAILLTRRMARLDEARWLADVADAVADRSARPEVRAAAHTARAILHDAAGDFAAAEQEFRASVELLDAVDPPDSLAVASARDNLGLALRAMGRFEDALAEHRQAHAIRREQLGPDHPQIARSHSGIASVLREIGRHTDAEAEQRKALAIERAAYGDLHPTVARGRITLAMTYEEQGRYEEAEAEVRAGLEALRNALGPEHPDVGTGYIALGVTLQHGGDLPGAESALREALRIQTRDRAEHPDTAATHNNLATVLEELGRYEEALPHLQRALEIRRAFGDAQSPSLIVPLANLGNVLLRLGQGPQALEHAEAAWALALEHEPEAIDRGWVAWVLARARWETSTDRDGALALAREAIADYGQAGKPAREVRSEVEAWLAAREPS